MKLLDDFNIKTDNMEIYDIAFSHSSYCNEHNLPRDYQRLEFLGDKVLDLIMSDYLYNETDYEEGNCLIYDGGYFNCELTPEEINILATYMVVEWLGQQLASVENTRMKYSGSDFKFTSQANHMAKILTMKADYEREGFHLQRLYKRRKKDEKGIMRSTFGSVMEVPDYDD